MVQESESPNAALERIQRVVKDMLDDTSIPQEVRDELRGLLGNITTANIGEARGIALAALRRAIFEKGLVESFKLRLETLIAQQQAEAEAMRAIEERLNWMSAVTSEAFIEENTTYNAATNRNGIYGRDDNLRPELIVSKTEAERRGWNEVADDEGSAYLVVRNGAVGTPDYVAGIEPGAYYTMRAGSDRVMRPQEVQATQGAMQDRLDDLFQQAGAIDPNTPAPERQRQIDEITLQIVSIHTVAGTEPQTLFQAVDLSAAFATLSDQERSAGGIYMTAEGQHIAAQNVPAGTLVIGMDTRSSNDFVRIRRSEPQQVASVNLDVVASNGRIGADGTVGREDIVAIADNIDKDNNGITADEVAEFAAQYRSQGIDMGQIADALRRAAVELEGSDAQSIAQGLGRYVPTPTQQASTNDRSAALG